MSSTEASSSGRSRMSTLSIWKGLESQSRKQALQPKATIALSSGGTQSDDRARPPWGRGATMVAAPRPLTPRCP